MKKTVLFLVCLFMVGIALADNHWVGTWGTAPQWVESHNNPPSPGLGNNSLRQIVQVSIGGEKVRLKLTNEFSSGATEIKAVELALAKTAGSSAEIDETSTVSLTFGGKAGVTMPARGTAISDPVSFKIGERQNVAITIHYGSASSTSVSGHPGSRTTSYLKAGNTTDFSDLSDDGYVFLHGKNFDKENSTNYLYRFKDSEGFTLTMINHDTNKTPCNWTDPRGNAYTDGINFENNNPGIINIPEGYKVTKLEIGGCSQSDASNLCYLYTVDKDNVNFFTEALGQDIKENSDIRNKATYPIIADGTAPLFATLDFSAAPATKNIKVVFSGNNQENVWFKVYYSHVVKTDHWYTIQTLEVEAPETAGAVAILGNSITDGRGSTTNQQNRWADVLSRRLLENEPTKQVGVLNMGIGGNCVLGGGLGPAAVNRYQRDLFGQEGVKWIILFEAVNDLGGSRNGVQTAKSIIGVYKQIIREAHQKGIYVFGATITPFKGNSYYSVDHENGRSALNKWIRTTKMLDGVIDFDKAVRNPEDTIAMQSQFLFENDWLHLNAKGYETMGGCIDLNLFTKTDALAADDEEEETYGEALWIEAEDLRTSTVGIAFQLVSDAAASGGKYLKTVEQFANSAPVDSIFMLTTTFTAKTAGTYYVYARVLCPTWDDDSYWVGVDGPMSNFVNGLQTDTWSWKELYNGYLSAGQHQLTIAGREDGACLDKLCITMNAEAPDGMGESPTAIARLTTTGRAVASVDTYTLSGILTTAQAKGPYIAVSRADDGTALSRKVILR